MGPRKNNTFTSGKEEGTASGKARKVASNGAGVNSTANAASHKHGATATADVYTNEERAFLESQMASFTSGGGGSGSTDFSGMTKEQWLAGLPTLVSATEKLLQAAAEQYQQTCRERAAAAALPANGAQNTSSSPSADGNSGGKHSATTSSSNANNSSTDGVIPGGMAGPSDRRPTPAGSTPAQFVEESAYIIAQAQQLQWYPFTYQRWVELLLEPGKYHTARDGRLRGDALQTSLRRCILVTYPAVEGGDLI
ncbi:hypothetical protein LSCM1_05334 [Leishmania martiniquensis]|uniref:Uncharacterized protein n=1 Tax=Leishmania martiniquensis TaxID=1580590 RepID=A0A836H3N1_9TRYP|nr:hypothetical protein LSCM1_05334 [Leishmania martiniquensis]